MAFPATYSLKKTATKHSLLAQKKKKRKEKKGDEKVSLVDGKEPAVFAPRRRRKIGGERKGRAFVLCFMRRRGTGGRTTTLSRVKQKKRNPVGALPGLRKGEKRRTILGVQRKRDRRGSVHSRAQG